jgi:hypothetical protein
VRRSITCTGGSRNRHLSAEKLVAELQRLDQGVDLGFGIVEPERGPAGRGDAQPLHQRHGAMGAGPNGNALLVKNS